MKDYDVKIRAGDGGVSLMVDGMELNSRVDKAVLTLETGCVPKLWVRMPVATGIKVDDLKALLKIALEVSDEEIEKTGSEVQDEDGRSAEGE